MNLSSPNVLLVALVVVLAVAVITAVVLSLRRRRHRGVDAHPLREHVETTGAAVDSEDVDRVLDRMAEPAEPQPPPRPSLRERLGRARAALGVSLSSVLDQASVSDETWDDLTEALIRADVGLATSVELAEVARARAAREGGSTPQDALRALRDAMRERLHGPRELARRDDGQFPSVWLFVGVNGSGKTTTIGKVARREVEAGARVVVAAGDTFRAAAADQLSTWAQRAGADIVRGADGADPASVVFDAVASAAANEAHLVLADTAGRLHTERNLMDELRKVRRVAGKGPGVVTETLLVLDATTGQNGLAQARKFTEAVDVTGVVLTKLDGSAKGGIVLAVQSELDIPVKLVGVGEGPYDLVPFDAEEFVEALFA